MTAALFPSTYVFRALTTSGALAPLSGGLLYFYKAGTLTPQAAYTDPSGTTPCSNPLVLDGNGVATFCLQAGLNYKIQLTDANGVVQDGYPVDNIAAGDVSAALVGSNRYAVDSGSLNAYVVALSTPITSNYNGLRITFKATHSNTGPTTFDSGAGPIALVTQAGTPLTAGTIISGGIYEIIYDGATTKFWLVDAVVSVTYATDTGAANAYAIAIQAGSDYNGLWIAFKAAHTNSGASTINATGTIRPILSKSGLPLLPGAIIQGQIIEMIYDSATTSYWMVSEPVPYALDTGVANAYVVSTNPQYAAGLYLRFKVGAGNSNTSSCTINAGGGVVPLVGNNGTALVNGNLLAGTIYEAIYDLTTASWWVINPTTMPIVGNTMIYNVAGAYSWFCLPGVTRVMLTLQGAGGPGGGSGPGFGGSSGLYVQQPVAVKPHNYYTVTVGASGAVSSFAWSSFDGTSGYVTDSGFVTITMAAGATGAAGTNGGSAATGTPPVYTQTPEVGWSAATALGVDSYTALTHVHGGYGATSAFGTGGVGGADNGNVNGTAGVNPGSGGGGAATVGGVGGAGAPGYARIQF